MNKVVCPWCGIMWDTQVEAIRCAKICEELIILDRIDKGVAHPHDTGLTSSN